MSDGAQHVTLDWGKEKVHLASGRFRYLGSGTSGFKAEEALCGYVVGKTPKEGTLDEVDEEFVCKRCQKRLTKDNQDTEEGLKGEEE